LITLLRLLIIAIDITPLTLRFLTPFAIIIEYMMPSRQPLPATPFRLHFQPLLPPLYFAINIAIAIDHYCHYWPH